MNVARFCPLNKHRLTSETIANAPSGKNGAVSYGLDPVGNRTSASSGISGLTPISGTFNPDDELASETYDQNGNVTATGGRTFTYDAENHLVSMGSTVALQYDGDGNRVAKATSSGTTYYLVDDLNPTGYPQVVDELVGGAVTRTYTYGLQRISQYQPISGTWTASFYGYDGGGNVRTLTNAAGAITDTYEYDGFGVSVNTSGNTPNEMLFAGEQWDPDLGLYYLRARYYNPLTGRLVSRDALDGDAADPGSLHKYLYAKGDPVNLKDPTGQEAAVATGLLDLRALGAAVGLVAEARAISCTLMLAASELGAYTFQYEVTGIDWVSCSVKAKKRWRCSAHCHIVNYRNGGNTIIGPSSLGFGNTETEACQAAKDEAQAQSPRGSYTRHCKCDECTRM